MQIPRLSCPQGLELLQNIPDIFVGFWVVGVGTGGVQRSGETSLASIYTFDLHKGNHMPYKYITTTPDLTALCSDPSLLLVTSHM